MFDDLSLYIIKVAVQVKCLPASALGTIAFHVPHRQWNTPLATELALCPVDGDSSHHWCYAVLDLTLVHVEQYRKCGANTTLRVPYPLAAVRLVQYRICGDTFEGFNAR